MEGTCPELELIFSGLLFTVGFLSAALVRCCFEISSDNLCLLITVFRAYTECGW